MTDQSNTFPDFYVTREQACPYLPGRKERKLFTQLSGGKARGLIDGLLKNGFRRSQNIAYLPYCTGCHQCVSVRVLADEFRRTKSMKRVMRLNRDIQAYRIPAVPTREQYALFRSYIDSRHADGGMAEMSMLDYMAMVEDSVVDTFLTEYRLPAELADLDCDLPWPEQAEHPFFPISLPKSTIDDPAMGRLVGVALWDRLSDGLSLVYSFFDPALSARSPGTFIILDHIDYAVRMNLPYVYLGYWVRESAKMNYKIRYQPQEHLLGDGWQRVDGV